mmetsp:Transcript_17361/g.45943  ORF Transcript_17361/g.45943 Transcript_17361/m.45943 type:complete len:97 (+) Transcript_17361:1567-1857(+)
MPSLRQHQLAFSSDHEVSQSSMSSWQAYWYELVVVVVVAVLVVLVLVVRVVLVLVDVTVVVVHVVVVLVEGHPRLSWEQQYSCFAFDHANCHWSRK